MCVSYIPRICYKGCNFFLIMCVINLIKCMGGYMTCCHRNFFFKRRGKQSWQQKKGKKKKSDSIYGQYTNVCKLGANWDH